MRTLLLLLSFLLCLTGYSQTITPAGPTGFCTGGSVNVVLSVTPVAGGTYQWQKDGSDIAGATGTSYTANATGAYTVIVTTGGTPSTSNTVNVTASAPVVPSFTSAPTSQCGTVPVYFTNTTPSTGLTYSWSFGDPNSGGNNTSTATNPVHTFIGTPGNSTQNFTVTLTADNAGCVRSATNSVVVLQRPGTQLNGTGKTIYNDKPYFVQCVTSAAPFTFTNVSSTSASNQSYKIIWGDNSADFTATNFTTFNHTYNIGTYTLQFIVNGPSCSDTAIYYVFIGGNPTGSISSPGSTTGCAGSTFDFPFSNISGNPPGTEYYISVDDGSGAAVQYVQANVPAFFSHTFNKSSCDFSPAKTFTVTYLFKNPCGETPGTIGGIRISKRAGAAFTIAPKDTVCQNTVVTFSNTGSAGSTMPTTGTNCMPGNSIWQISPATGWSLTGGSSLGTDNGSPLNGDAWTSGSVTLTVNFTAPGTYTIKLKSGTDKNTTNKCGIDSIIKTICVNPTPVGTFTLSQTSGCGPLTINTVSSTNTPICGVNKFNWSVTYAPATGCVPATIGYTYTNGTNANSPQPVFQFVNPGTYTIGLVITGPAATCSTTIASQQVVVRGKPNVTFALPATACQNQLLTLTATATCNMTGTPGPTYLWTVSGGAASSPNTLNPGTIIFNTSGSQIVALAVTNECGSTTLSQPITINPVPDVSGTNNIVTCAGSTVGPLTFTSTTAGTTFTWTNSNNNIGLATSGTGATINSFTATNTTPNSIAGTITVTATKAGCSTTQSFTITVNPKPADPVVTSPIAYCQNAIPIPLTATVVTGHNLLWYSSITGGIGSTIAPTPSTTSVGTIVYYVSQTNQSTGCESGRSAISVVVNPVPSITATFTNPTGCGLSTGKIVIASLNAGAVYTVNYSKNGTPVTLLNQAAAAGGTITISNLSAGTYSNISVAINGCTSNSSGPFTLTDPNPPAMPTAGTNAPICSGSTLNLTATPTISGATYSWNGPNGYTSNVQNPTITNASTNRSGTYFVTVTVSGCTSSPAPVDVLVNQTPVTPTVTGNSPVCSGSAINLTATTSTTGVVYSWTGPSGFISSAPNPNILNATTAASGTYSVIATVGTCSSATATVTVTVNLTPSITATSTNPSTCSSATGSIILSGLLGSTTYTYNYIKNGIALTGSGTSSPIGTITITNLTAGTYSSITVTRNGCTSNAVGPFTLSDPNPPATPVASVANSPLCSGQTLNLAASSTTSGVSYLWSGPTGFTSTLQNPTRSNVGVADAGTYSVTVTLAGCSSAAGTVNVVINQTPATATLTSNSPVCSGDNINLNAATSTSGVTWAWTGPNGYTSTQQNPTIVNATAADAGIYSVVATALLGGCSSMPKTITIVVNTTPAITSATAVNPTTCNTATGSIELTGLAANTMYAVIYTKNGTTVTVNLTATNNGIVIITGLTSGVYDNIKVARAGCSSNQVGPYTLVDPNPPVTPIATSNGPVCSGKTLTLNASTTTAGAVTWLWTGPNGFTSILPSPSINNVSAAAGGTYLVTAKLAGCASAAASVNVIVSQTPAAPLVSSNSPVCTDSTLTLFSSTPFANALTWLWTGPNGFTSTLQNPVISNVTIAAAGSYKLTITATAGLCASAESATTVSINATPGITGSTFINPATCNTASGSITLNGLSASMVYTVGYKKNGLPQTATLTAGTNGTLVIPNLSAGTYTNIGASLTGCSSNIVGPFTLTDPNPPATPVAVSNGPICTGNQLQLSATTTSTGTVTFNWTGPNSFTSSQQNPSIANATTTASGTYSVTVTLSGCTSPAATLNVVVNQSPTAPVAGYNGPVCAGSVINLSAASASTGAINYSWAGPSGFTSLQQNPSIANSSVADAGLYTVVATTTVGACPSAPGSVQVVVHPALDNLIDTSAQAICFSQPVTISGTPATGGNGSYSYQWEQSPDNVTWTAISAQTGASITIIPTGNIYLRRKVTGGPCQSFSLPAYIAVQPPVTNNTIQQDGVICINTVAATLIGSVPVGANGSYIYQWEKSTNGGATWSTIIGASGKDYSPGVLNTATKYRRLVTTNLCNGPQSSTSNIITITVNPDAVALFLPTDTVKCPPFVITPSVVNLQPSAANSQYVWYANGVQIGNAATFPGYTIANENDSVIINLKVVSAFGCKDDSLSRKFKTIKKPTPSFTLTDTVGCGPITITATNTSNYITEFTYFWDFGNGQISTAIQPPPITFAPNPAYGDTVYVVKLKVFSPCDTLVFSRSIRVKSGPKALFTPTRTTGCSPMVATFRNTSKGLNNTYFWDFGDGATFATSSPDSVQHTFITGVVDTFYVKLRAVNECGSDSITYSIIVAPNTIRLNLAVNGTDLFGCAPHAVPFINNSQGASVFSWAFGDGSTTTTTRNVDTVYHTYLTPGTYVVTLRAINNCSDTTTTATITVYPKPRAQFTASTFNLCKGDSVRFTNLSDSATAYLWKFGDGATSILTNPLHIYTTPGVYVVKLITYRNNPSGNVCTDSAQQFITVTATQQGLFTATDSVAQCAPLTVTLVNKNKPSVTALWDFGDGTTTTGDSVVHTFQTFGNYVVKLTVTVPGGCTYISTKTVTVNGPGGTLQYTAGYNCSPAPVRLAAVATGATAYVWDFGDGITQTTTAPVVFHSYTNPGFYIPKLTLQNASGCAVLLRGIDTIKVDKVEGGFTFGKAETCGATTLTFTDTSRAFFGKQSIRWAFGDNTTGTGASPSHIYTAAGTYTVQMIVTGNSGCTDTVTKQIVVMVKSRPVAAINALATACTRSTITFTGVIQSADAVALTQWNLSNGATGVGPVFNHTFTLPGTYTLRLVVGTVNGCFDTAYHTITINPSPVVVATPSFALCRGNMAQLAVTGAASYQWLPLQGLSCYTCSTPVASPTITTPYVVEGKNSFGCADYDTVVVTVIQPLRMVVSPSDSICIGQSTNLSASGASLYNWSPAAGLNNTNISNPTASPTVTTTYRVVGYDGFNCFTDTAFVTVGVGQYPTVNLGPDVTLAAGTLYPLTTAITNGPITRWLWSPSTNLSCTNCAVPVAEIKKNISYKVVATTAYGCSASDTINIVVVCGDAQVFIPNAFTPDGDGLNDVLMVRASGIVQVKHFRIFNRWGDLVFERNNFAPNSLLYGWDGKVRGVVGGPDVFVYTCEAVCENGTVLTSKGNVSIIK